MLFKTKTKLNWFALLQQWAVYGCSECHPPFPTASRTHKSAGESR